MPRPTPIEQLRAWRTRPERAGTMQGEFDALARMLRQRERTFGAAGTAWIELVPGSLLPGTTLASLARGVLTVRCRDASVKFELDRWLRGGGELAMIRRCPAGLTKIRLVQ